MNVFSSSSSSSGSNVLGLFRKHDMKNTNGIFVRASSSSSSNNVLVPRAVVMRRLLLKRNRKNSVGIDRRASSSNDSTTSNNRKKKNERELGSLVPRTIEDMQKDEEFIEANKNLRKFGQRELTRLERERTRTALRDLEISKTFEEYLGDTGAKKMERVSASSIVQVNIGLYCNQACSHCHVESSPLRKSETMSESTRERVLEVLRNSGDKVKTLDITGCAPELAEEFRNLVKSAREMRPDLKIIDRCNLTVFYEPGQEDLGEFLRENDVTVVASLPCYSEKNTDAQRGKGVFERSIDALKLLNELGYGKTRTLDLMYNPGGAFLPPAQEKLELAYKSELKDTYGIEFSNLFTLTNMPIKRFADYLHREKKTEEYMKLLVDNYNVRAADNVMCRDVISIKWDGTLYDCDFNQQLDIGLFDAKKRTIFDIESVEDIVGMKIASDNHCFGCTAGSGSSCGGQLD